jgi:hypothetical protein
MLTSAFVLKSEFKTSINTNFVGDDGDDEPLDNEDTLPPAIVRYFPHHSLM